MSGLPILPYLMSEESISSWIGRASKISGCLSVRQLWSMCVGINSFPPIAFPSGLDRLSAALGIEDREALALGHTPLSAYRPFLNPRVYREAMATMLDDPKKVGGASAKLGMNYSACEARYCPECAVSDLKQCGCSYIHRLHCMPGVHVCVTHGCMLSSGCGRCGWSERATVKTRQPGTVCECGNALEPSIGVVSNDEFDRLYRISKNINDFLHVLGPSELERDQIGMAYREALANARIKSADDLIERMRQLLGKNLSRLLKLKLEGNSWMARLLGKNGLPPLNLIWNSLIVDGFFENTRHLMAVAANFESLASQIEVEACYAQLQEAIDRGRAINRRTLSQECSIEYGTINLIDRNWICRALGSGRQQRQFDFRKLDDDLLNHMRKALELLDIEARYPQKITRARLIRKYAGATHAMPFIKKLPKSLRFIKNNVDSPERFLCKVIRYIMRFDRDYLCTPEQKVRRIAGITAEVARALAESSMPNRGNEPQAVKDVIATRRLRNAARGTGVK